MLGAELHEIVKEYEESGREEKVYEFQGSFFFFFFSFFVFFNAFYNSNISTILSSGNFVSGGYPLFSGISPFPFLSSFLSFFLIIHSIIKVLDTQPNLTVINTNLDGVGERLVEEESSK